MQEQELDEGLRNICDSVMKKHKDATKQNSLGLHDLLKANHTAFICTAGKYSMSGVVVMEANFLPAVPLAIMAQG